MINTCLHFINENRLTHTTYFTVHIFTTILDCNHGNALTLNNSNEREKLIEAISTNFDSWKFEDCCLDLFFTTFKSEMENLKKSKYIIRQKFICWSLAYFTTPGTATKCKSIHV